MFMNFYEFLQANILLSSLLIVLIIQIICNLYVVRKLIYENFNKDTYNKKVIILFMVLAMIPFLNVFMFMILIDLILEDNRSKKR